MTITYEQMVLQHLPFLKAMAYGFTQNRHEAEDLVQTTLETLFKKSNKFIPGTNFKAWAHTILKNNFINDFRKKQRQQAAKSMPISESIENQGIHTYDVNLIQQAIDGLEDNIRIPFKMYLEGYSYQDIADQLEIPLGTIKSRIFYARKELKEKVKLLK